MDSEKIEKQTRKIFHEIHSKQGNDESTYDRLTSMYSHEYFHVDERFFNDKICLDAPTSVRELGAISHHFLFKLFKETIMDFYKGKMHEFF